MFGQKLGAVFVYTIQILLCEVTNQVLSAEDPSLFFSGPLEDELGTFGDQKKVTLTCNGGSRSGKAIKYKWLRDGQEINIGAVPRYTAFITGDLEMFPSDYTKDDGDYQCMVTDSAEEKWSLLSNTAELRIAYISGFTKNDVTESGRQGQPWKYVFSGYQHSKYPKPTFNWKFKGRTLIETNRISISEDGNLYIAQLSLDDGGKYSSELANGFQTQKRESISLQIAPTSNNDDISAVFMMGPKSKKVSLKREKEVTFECFASGRPMPEISWRKNGRTLQTGAKYVIKDFNKRLTVRELNEADNGQYQCAITRAAVKSVSEATLTVIVPPVVKSLEPKNQIVHIGNYTTLTCMVTGSFDRVRFSISWYRNGVKLSPDSRILMTERSHQNYRNYTLNITRLKKDPDEGMYQCFARNEGGEGMAYTSVEVIKLPPNITFGPGVVYAVLGRPAQIRCIATGSPPITFTWEKNGYPINNPDPPDNGKNGIYVIRDVQRSDVAQYTCIARNGLRPIDVHKSSGRLEIVGRPVVNKSSIVYVAKGSHPYLYCGVRYDPKVNATFRWYFKGDQVRNDGKRELKYDGRLVIKGVSEQEGGIYRCEARSVVGNYSTTVEVIVQAPPLVTTAPQVDDIRPDSVRLLWKAGYDSNSAIIYFVIGLKFVDNDTEVVYINRAMPSGDIRKYVVPGLTPSTKYQFRVRAVNAVGYGPWSKYSKVATTLEAAPTYRLKKVTGSAVNDDTINVQWEYPPKHTHNGVLLGYYVAWKYAGVTSGQFTTRKVTPATETKFQITNLILNSPYEVKVQMFNAAGAGPYSDPVVIKTKEGIPSSAPRNFAVRTVSSRSVVLEWDAPPQQDWNGDLTDYIIRFWKFDRENVIDQRKAAHDPSAFIQVYNVTNLQTFTQYVFKVSAHNSEGGGPDAGPVQVKTSEDIPSAPQRLSIVDQFSDTITVSWVRPREVNGVLIGYVVKYWQVGTQGQEKSEEVAGHELQAGITSLRSNTKYMIEVAAKTKIGISQSARIEGRTLDTPIRPSAPSNLRFLEVNATALQLTWVEGSKGRSPITKYVIEGNNETGFANDETSQWFDALIVNDPYKIYNLPPVIIENLRPATVYRFRVKAFNKVGPSPASPKSMDITTADAPPSSPPLNIKVESASSNPGELLLTWKIPPEETWNSPFISYTVVLHEVGKRSNFSGYQTSGINGRSRSFKLPSLKKFTTYEIQMKTVNEIGESPFSPVVYGQTREYVPDLPPANIRAIGSSGTSINITWDVVPKDGRNGIVTGYKVFYRLFRYAPERFKEIAIGNVTSYLLKNLMGYTQYDIRLLASTKVGDGKRSKALRPYPRTLETKPGPPSRLRFPAIDASLVTVSWDVPELTGGNITMYRVYYRLRDEVGAPLIRRPTVDSTRRTETVLGLSGDKYYVFEVRAHTAVGWGTPARAEVYTSRDGNKGKAEIPLILPISDFNITSHSIAVGWAVVTRRRQPIRFFTLELRKGQGAWENYPKPLNGDDRRLIVWGLEPGRLYSFRISSTIDANTSPFSKPSPPVRTLADAKYGTPRDVRITSLSPTTLTVEWKPPSLVDVQGTVLQYRLGYRKHDGRPPDGSEGFFPVLLSSDRRKYTITGLEESTLYDIRLNAVDEFRQDLTYYLETRRTADGTPPRPNLHQARNVGPTSVTLTWDPPNSKNTVILGYKAVYEDVPSKRRRRRRAVLEVCERPEPGVAYFSNTSTQGTITNLNMYTRYRIVLKSFNSAGDSEGSDSVTVTTAEGVPGPPATFGFDGVYGNEVHLYWEPPCERNGRLQKYKLTVSEDTSRRLQEIRPDSDVTEYQVKGLTLETSYQFELVATTSVGEGIPKILKTKTKGAPVAPRPPIGIRASAEKNVVTLTWRNGFDGNTPLTKYIIEYKTSSERNPWVVGWTLEPSAIKKNRTAGTVWTVLRDLNGYTNYWFRIMVENEVARSSPSDPSSVVKTGRRVGGPSPPIYEELWFIIVMGVIGLLILILLVICIVLVVRRRSRGRVKRIAHPAYELDVQPSQGIRPSSTLDDNVSNGGPKSKKEEKHLVDESEEDEEEREEDEASSLETKSDVSESESEDDIPTKKRQMEEALREQDKYYPNSKPPRSFSSDNVQGSPPPAYATFANRGNARSEPFLDPYGELDDDDDENRRNPNAHPSPFNRPPTRRTRSAFSPYDGDESDSSEIQRRKRGDPRSSSFRRALISGKPEPEPERPVGFERDPDRRPKPTPRKYRSLEKAVNESAKPPSYEDDDDDDVDVEIRQPDLSRRFMTPPDYRSDSGRESGRDSSDDHDRVPLTQSRGRFDLSEGSESPAPAYHSSTDDSSENPDRRRLLDPDENPQPEISSYSSFV